MFDKQQDIFIPTADFRSDTVSRPSAGMRKAMCQAEVGDDVYGEDPTINSFQNRVAKLFGHQAGLFLPSSTMGNLVSALTHCPRGSAAIIGSQSHIYKFQAGGISQNGGVFPIILPNNYDGTINIEDIEKQIPPKDPHLCPLSMIALECTHNMMNGSILDFKYIEQVKAIADKNKLKLHLDGCRILNAAVAKGVDPIQFTKYFDSVNLCLSKGLGCPVGAVITGSAEFISKARHQRKRMGGGMRQAGILAAAGHYALDRYKEQMKIDHQNQKYIRDSVKKIGDGQLIKVVHQDVVHTNISFYEITSKANISSIQLVRRLKQDYGILVNTRPMGTDIRIVTHLDVGRDKCQLLVKALNEILMSTTQT